MNGAICMDRAQQVFEDNLAKSVGERLAQRQLSVIFVSVGVSLESYHLKFVLVGGILDNYMFICIQ